MPGALLIDGNSLLYRAFFALPPLNAPDGTPTNAVYGFLSMLQKAIAEETPEYIAVAFDLHGPTFRHLRYADYKGTRAPTPEELRPQFPLLKELLRAMGILVLQQEGYEADDLLGTASRICAERGIPSLLVTGDRDSFQLTGNGVEVLYTKRGISDTERITEEVIRQRYGITPPQLIDMKALCGDTSDNIPGVPGIGEKTAAKLVAKYGTLEACLSSADTEEKGKLRERLLAHGDLARLCRFLAEIDRHAPVDFTPEGAKVRSLSGAQERLLQLGLKTVAQRILSVSALYTGGNPVDNSVENAENPVESPVDIPVDNELSTVEALSHAAASLTGQESVALYLSDSRLSIAKEGGESLSLVLGQQSLLQPGIGQEEALQAVSALLSSPVHKVLCGSKALRTRLSKMGLTLGGTSEDLSLAAYVCNPQHKSFTAEGLLTQEGLPLHAAALFTLQARLNRHMQAEGLLPLLHTVEQPLTDVLYRMEQTGFAADKETLSQLGAQYSQRLLTLEKEITAIAGHPLNIQSPKQLAALLFDELALVSPKKGAQARSTSAEVLEQLDHPVVDRILEYRKYAKLNGTYIEGLLRLLRVPGGDGRIHTQFDQVATATGRLSSLEPNLQNIPIRSELGRDIRKAFVAKEGCVLLDADYSQIELRVLAHMADDARMQAAFCSGEDIHRRTAAEIYGVPMEQVTPQMRSAAKAVNFGIVYGISDFGLSRNTGLSRAQAADFIKMYLTRYPAIALFMQESVEKAKADGYAQTLLLRRRYIPELSSSNRSIRLFGERVAMNSPIQGTAADIIKLAMIAVDKALVGMGTRLILQVHDELILEAPQEEAEEASALLKREMEGVLSLKVPLRADVSTGKSWYDCK